MALLRTQKNEVFEMMRAAGFDPRLFEWKGDTLYFAPANDEYWFAFAQDDKGRHYVEYRPGRGSERTQRNGLPWGVAVDAFAHWLEAVRREHEAPDLWADLAGEGAHAVGVENTPFTPAEQVQISRVLRELSENVRANFELTAGQLAAIDERLTYLEDAAGREGIGRIDWRNIFVGAFVTLGLEAVLRSDVVRAAVMFGLHALVGLFGGDAMPELPGGPGMLT